MSPHNEERASDDTRLYEPWEKPYYVLSAGDVYDMKARRIIEYGTGATPPPARQPQ